MKRQNITIICFLILILFPGHVLSETGDKQSDSWGRLKDAFPIEKEEKSADETYDPWAELRTVYLPFTEKEEEEAVVDTQKRKRFYTKLARPLNPYMELINECSRRFNVPREVIGAVILVESGGNAKASAKTSSAKGLMQTIKGTFRQARSALIKEGVCIENNPFNSRSSIYAGTWYLSRQFEKAKKDNPTRYPSRLNIEDWALPAKYYYAGPNWGARKEDIIITYMNGKRLVVDKKTYCNKVMRYARILKNGKGPSF